jgi:hypothetical protein
MLTPWRRFLEVVFRPTLAGLQATLRPVRIALVCDINAAISWWCAACPDTRQHAQVCFILGTAMTK